MKVAAVAPFGAEAHEVDLGTASVGEIDDIKRHLDVVGLLIFRGQRFDDDQQVKFASHFGKFTQLNPEDRESLTYRFNNVEGVGRGVAPWHSDNAWTPYPLKYIMLFGDNVTTDDRPLVGGETLFASAALALDRLPDELVTELRSLSCRLSGRRNPDQTTIRPCIEKHWSSSLPYLVPNELLTDEIIGVSPDRSRDLLSTIFAVLYDQSFVYRHAWHDGDFVLWDNRLVQHSRTAYDENQNRVLRRCGIADDAEPGAVTAA